MAYTPPADISRFRRTAIRGLGIISATSCILIAILWMASNRNALSDFTTSFVHDHGNRVGQRWFFMSKRGVLAVGRLEARFPEPTGGADDYPIDRMMAEFSVDSMPIWKPYWEKMAAEPRDTLARKLGFSYVQGSQPFNGIPYSHWWLAVPHWLVILPFVGLMILWLRVEHAQWRFRVQKRRLEQGLCPRCAYDVRATPARCPECGVELSSNSL